MVSTQITQGHLKLTSVIGIYVCEDCGTSYLPDYGGGLKREGTFIEYMKDKIDKLNLTLLGHIENNPIGTSTFGIYFYNSMVVLEKRKIGKHTNFSGGKNLHKLMQP